MNLIKPSTDECHRRLYNFIFNRLKDYGGNNMNKEFCNAPMFKTMAEKHYGFPEYDMKEWEMALLWATANIFGDGCECETI